MDENQAYIQQLRDKIQELEAKLHAKELFSPQKVLQYLDEQMVYIDESYRIIEANPAFLQFHDLLLKPIENLTLADTFGEEIFQYILKETINKCFSGEYQSIDFPFLHQAKKQTKNLWVKMLPPDSPDKKIVCLLIKAESIVSFSRKKLGKAFNTIEEIVLIISRNFEILDINKSGLDLLDLPMAEVLHKNCHQIIYN